MNILTVDLDCLGVWRLGIFFGVMMSLIGISFRFSKKIPAAALALWIYVLSWCILTIEFPYMRYGSTDTAFVASAGRTFVEAALVPLFVLCLNEFWDDFLRMCLALLVCVEIFLLAYQGYGLMLMASFDTALIALFIPFAPIWLVIASLITIFIHHGSTAILILIVQLVAMAIKKPSIRKYIVFGFPAAFAFVWFRFHDLALGSTDRLAAYKRYMGAWWNDKWLTHLIGTGPGSFQWISLMIDGYKPPHFLQMHSDWLQITFELGFIGLFFVLFLFYKALKCSWNDPRTLSAVCGCGAIGATYHGLRFFPSMLMIAWIFKKALLTKRKRA